MNKLIKSLALVSVLTLALGASAQSLPQKSNGIGNAGMVASQAAFMPGMSICRGVAQISNYSGEYVRVYYTLEVEDAYGRLWTMNRTILLAPYGTGYDSAGGFVLNGDITNWVN